MNDNAWVYGSLIVYVTGECAIASMNKPRNIVPFYANYKTVGQYTGLMDKNGEKIFEGDIIKFDKPHGDWGCLAEIIFENGAYMYRPITNAEKVWNCIFAAEETLFSIIGNIHDNPELLEK